MKRPVVNYARPGGIIPNCIRTHFISAGLALEDEDYMGALVNYEDHRRVGRQITFRNCSDPYIEAAEIAGQQERCRGKLKDWAEDYNGISLILKLTDFIALEKGGEQAGKFLVDALASKPSVRGLDRLIDLKAEGHLERRNQ